MSEFDFSGLPRTRLEAKSDGALKFFTGVPCGRGHVSPRYTSTRQCVQCLDEWTIKWREENPGRARKSSDEWRLTNSDHVKGLARKRYAETIEGEKGRERARRWRSENPEMVRHQTRLRRARRLGNGGEHNKEDVEYLLRLQRYKCAECGVSVKTEYHVDHILPLCKDGSNAKTNLQILCAPCNQSKGGKHPLEWARQQGRLL